MVMWRHPATRAPLRGLEAPNWRRHEEKKRALASLHASGEVQGGGARHGAPPRGQQAKGTHLLTEVHESGHLALRGSDPRRCQMKAQVYGLLCWSRLKACRRTSASSISGGRTLRSVKGPSLSLDVANLTLATERGEGNVGDLHPEGVFSEGSHWRRGAVWG